MLMVSFIKYAKQLLVADDFLGLAVGRHAEGSRASHGDNLHGMHLRRGHCARRRGGEWVLVSH